MGGRVTAHLMLLPMSCCCCCGPRPSVSSFLLFLFVRLRLCPSLYAFSLMLWGFDTWTTRCPPRSIPSLGAICGVLLCVRISRCLCPQLIYLVLFVLCINSAFWPIHAYDMHACKTNFHNTQQKNINLKLSLGETTNPYNKIIMKCYNLIRIKNLITCLDIQISTNTI